LSFFLFIFGRGDDISYYAGNSQATEHEQSPPQEALFSLFIISPSLGDYLHNSYYVPNIDHYEATSAWINGKEWTDVANTICANSMRLHERTLAGIVATYVSQMFEYRLPWVLGAVAVAIKEMGGAEKLCEFLDDLPACVRYGVNVKEAVTISKLCQVERLWLRPITGGNLI